MDFISLTDVFRLKIPYWLISEKNNIFLFL